MWARSKSDDKRNDGRAHPEWTAAAFEIAIQHVPDKLLLLARLLHHSHAADHPPRVLHAEERLEELALAGGRLVDPSEHVADVALRIVGVELDRSRETVRTTSREGVREKGEHGGRAQG